MKRVEFSPRICLSVSKKAFSEALVNNSQSDKSLGLGLGLGYKIVGSW